MKFTMEGRRFLFASVLLLMAAFNTGNNLIYLVLSLMLALLLTALLVPFVNFKGLSLRIQVDQPVFAGDNAEVTSIFSNRKKRFNSYSVRLLNRRSRQPVYAAAIPAGGDMAVQAAWVFPKRGLVRFEKELVRSGFPFILFERSAALPASGKVLVYPRLLDLKSLFPVSSEEGTIGLELIRRSGDNIHALRDFQSGDDARNIHWKASARTGDFIVREYAENESETLSVLLDNLGAGTDELFEKAVSLAGSVCSHFLDLGFSVQLISAKKVVPFGSGSRHLFAILDLLAVVSREEAFESAIPAGHEGMAVYVLQSVRSRIKTAGAPGEIILYADSI